ncbi:MAG: recombinase family protein, partial [Caulobacteraceae bacterium]|nr:recombinase family protein [Caulobacteraceae bacterium]
MRVALYARYSSDRQNERSIADQIEAGRRHAAAKGWTIVATFSDAAISGFAMANRPGVNQMLAQAEAGAFDLVLVEDEDRLARNDEHNAFIFNLLTYHRVGLATLTSDRVSKAQSGLKGLLA